MTLAALLMAAPAAPVYEVMAELGWNKTVYVAAPAIKDQGFYEEVIPKLLDRFGRDHPVQIEFYDDKELTPRKKPYTKEQLLHQKAKFNFNPRNGMQKFVWMDFTPAGEKLKLTETEVELNLPAPASP